MVSVCLFTGWRDPLVPTTHDAIGQLQITWGLPPPPNPGPSLLTWGHHGTRTPLPGWKVGGWHSTKRPSCFCFSTRLYVLLPLKHL